MPSIQRIAVIDPALGQSGVHNAAFAAMLAEQCRGWDESLGFWCNSEIRSVEFANPLDGWRNVHPVFKTDFFKIFKKSGNAVDHWPWIRQLAQEYVIALRQVASQWDGGKVHVLHHTLSWEHATALTLSIRRIGDRGANLLHLCLLLYHPGTLAEGIGVELGSLRFRQAFHGLWQCPNVRLFASCDEYAETYARLLELPHALPIHPFFLVHGEPACFRDTAEATENLKPAPKTTLMYLGQVRNEKGFQRLPTRLRQALALGSAGDTWVVQYVGRKRHLAWEQATISELQSLARKNKAITIYEGFWDDSRITRELQQADRLLLDYHSQAYLEKTSGVLWLAAWHDLEVILPRDTWLAREATRLGVRLAFAEDGWPRLACKRNSDGTDTSYRHALFRPFLPWLRAQK
jgi:hypothetical protein